MRTPTIFHVANYILLFSRSYVTKYKLGYLCYYSQAYHIAWSGKQIFNEDFVAWMNGAVSKDLLERLKDNFEVPITTFSYADINELYEDERESIDVILNTYQEMKPFQLRNQIRDEDPWKLARKGVPEYQQSDNIITKQSMFDYYIQFT